MQAVKNPFVKVINGNHQFSIPVFQRDYSWTTEQCQQFWNDVLRLVSIKTWVVVISEDSKDIQGPIDLQRRPA